MAQSKVRKSGQIQRVRFDRWGYIFITPFFLIFLTFQLYPILNTFYLSFTNMKGASTEHQIVGLSNFGRASQSINLTGVEAEKAHSLVKALADAGITADTDAPAPAETSTADDPFSLGDATTEAPTADAGMSSGNPDAFSLGTETDAEAPTGFFVKVTGLEKDVFDKALATLTVAGVSSADLTKATETIYAGLLFDQKFWQAFSNTAILFFFNFVPQLFFALVFAVWFTDVSLKIRLGGFFKTIFYLPNIITSASVAVLFASLFGYPSGPINQAAVQTLNLPEAINFFRSEIWTRGIVSFIQFWLWFGSTIIVLTAGILGISPALFESAVVDGAKPGQIFTRITLPLLRPIMSFTLVTSLIGGLQMFDIPYLITNRRGDPAGSITTTAIYLYNQAFSSANNYSYAATISVGMFLLILVLAGILYTMMRDDDAVPKKAMK
jgi:multiple sugar transport system permease protein